MTLKLNLIKFEDKWSGAKKSIIYIKSAKLHLCRKW